VIAILAPLTWIRTIETFKIFFIFSGIVILASVITISIFDSIRINDDNGEAGPEWKAFNEDNYWTMVGLSFFMFEGIPTILPIMEASNEKENFSIIIIIALSTLCLINITFSELCYYAFGDYIKEPLIILQMPEENPAIIIDKILMSF
jgi:amino acid permease